MQSWGKYYNNNLLNITIIVKAQKKNNKYNNKQTTGMIKQSHNSTTMTMSGTVLIIS